MSRGPAAEEPSWWLVTRRRAIRRRLAAVSLGSGSSAAFGTVLVLLGRDRVALKFPRPRERAQGGSSLVGIHCVVVVEDLVDVVGHDGREHVQHLVTFVTSVEQPRRGLPDLRRIVSPKLVGDDLVHRYVERGADRVALQMDLGQAGVDGAVKFGVLSQDQNSPVVRIVGVQEREVDALELARCRRYSEAAAIVARHAAKR